MSDNSNLAIGAGIGAVAGAGIGYKVSLGKKAVKSLAYYNPANNIQTGTAEFAEAQKNWVNEAAKKAANAGKDFTQQLRYKAANGFKRMVEHLPNAQKLAKSTKIKWTAGIAAAGALAGATITAVANKIKAKKAQETK